MRKGTKKIYRAGKILKQCKKMLKERKKERMQEKLQKYCK